MSKGSILGIEFGLRKTGKTFVTYPTSRQVFSQVSPSFGQTIFIKNDLFRESSVVFNTLISKCVTSEKWS